MEGQGKRLLLAVALALGVMMLWQVIFPPDRPKPKVPALVTVPEHDHQHYITRTAPDQPNGVTSRAGAVGKEHEHGWVRNPDGSIAVQASADHSHTAVTAAAPTSAPPPVTAAQQSPVGKPMLDACKPGGPPKPVTPAPPAPEPTTYRVVGAWQHAGVENEKSCGAKVKTEIAARLAKVGTIVVDKTVTVSGFEPAAGATVQDHGATAAGWVSDDNGGQRVEMMALREAGVGFNLSVVAKNGTRCADAWSAVTEKLPSTAAPPQPEPTKPVEIARAPEQEQVFEFEDFRAVTSSYGGVLKQWKLLDPKYERDNARGDMVPPNSPGDLRVNFANSPDCTFKSTEVIPEEAVWTPRLLSPTQIEYVFESDALRVVKTFTFFPANHLVALKVDVSSKIAAQQTLGITLYGYQNPQWSTAHARGNTEWKAACMRGEVRTHSTRAVGEKPRLENGVQWGGFTNGYVEGGRLTAAQAGQFLVAVAPRPTESGEIVACNAYAVAGTPGLMQVDLLFQPTTVFKAGDPPVSREVIAYLGPTFYDWLEQSDSVAGFSTGFQEVPDFGWFGFIGRPLLWLLHKFYALVGNWGIAIIMLTLLVKLATLYWTTKSIRSMKAMAALAPKMKELQAKHGSDRAKLQQETMAMYKQYGVNPLAGCLPILLQMPIWIALYRMLSAAGELYLETLIPGWIDDLTATDPYYILPIVLIVVMFAQAKLQPQTTTGFQQKMLMYGIPLVFGIASFFFPAGLSLYIVTNTILSALHSIYMNKFDKKGPAMAAAIAAKGAAAGKDKDAKDARPEKTKKVIEVEDRSQPKAKPADDDSDDSSADDDDEEDEADDSAAAPAASSLPVASAQRPRRTSRSRRKRRGKN